MRLLVRHHLIIAVAATLVFFTNLGGPNLWDDDEPRNATCAREMLLRGDWIVPTFNAVLRTDKPVLIYWLMMSAYKVFGDNEFAARFWSALCAVGTSICTYHLGRILYRPAVGLWAGIAMCTAIWFGFTGRAATPDSAMIFLTTLALTLFAKFAIATETVRTGESATKSTWRDFAIIYAIMALAVLAKGPVGVVLPIGVMGMYLLLMRGAATETEPRPTSRWGALDAAYQFVRRMISPREMARVVWSMRPLTLILMLGAIALPWYVAVGVQTHGQWLAGFLGKHNLTRFTSTLENHGGGIFYYIPTILAGFFPWSIFLPLSLWRGVQAVYHRQPLRPAAAFLLCWVGMYFVFFSLAQTKLPNYVLPAYPALAVLVGAFVEHWMARPGHEAKFWMRTAFVVLAGVGIAGLIGASPSAVRLLPGETWINLVGLVPLVGGLTGLVLMEARKFRRAIAVTAVTAVLLSTTIYGFVSLRISQYQTSERLVQSVKDHAGDDWHLATYEYQSPSLVYYAGQTVPLYHDTNDLLQELHDHPSLYVVFPAGMMDAVKPVLPDDYVVLSRERWFLKTEELVLMGKAVKSEARNPKSETNPKFK